MTETQSLRRKLDEANEEIRRLKAIIADAGGMVDCGWGVEIPKVLTEEVGLLDEHPVADHAFRADDSRCIFCGQSRHAESLTPNCMAALQTRLNG